jgi:hypothetical protein
MEDELQRVRGKELKKRTAGGTKEGASGSMLSGLLNYRELKFVFIIFVRHQLLCRPCP